MRYINLRLLTYLLTYLLTGNVRAASYLLQVRVVCRSHCGVTELTISVVIYVPRDHNRLTYWAHFGSRLGYWNFGRRGIWWNG